MGIIILEDANSTTIKENRLQKNIKHKFVYGGVLKRLMA